LKEIQMPFSIVKDDETFLVAFHISHGTLPLVKKALAAIPTLVSHLKTFKLVFVLFSKNIEQIRIFTEEDIYDILDFTIKENFIEGDSFENVMALSYSFDTTGYKKNIFVYTTVHLKSGLNSLNAMALYNVIWLHEKGCDFGKKYKSQRIGIRYAFQSIGAVLTNESSDL
jgi:hypothetical protein